MVHNMRVRAATFPHRRLPILTCWDAAKVSKRADEPRNSRTMIRLCIRLGTFCNEPVCASLRTLDLDVFAVISRPKPFCAFGAWELSKGSVDCHWGEQAAPS